MPFASNSREGWKSSAQAEIAVQSADTALRPQRVSSRDNDCVDIASEDSFPASDAPSWTVVTGTGGIHRTESD